MTCLQLKLQKRCRNEFLIFKFQTLQVAISNFLKNLRSFDQFCYISLKKLNVLLV